MADFFDEEGTKVTVKIEPIKRTLLEKVGVVTVEAALLDQNDLGCILEDGSSFSYQDSAIQTAYTVSFH